MILAICLPICRRDFYALRPSAHESSHIKPYSMSIEEHKKSITTSEIGCSRCDTILIIKKGSEIQIDQIGNYDDGIVGMWNKDIICTSDINHKISVGKKDKWSQRNDNLLPRYLTQANIDKNKKIIDDAKFIYVCLKSLIYSRNQSEWIVSQIDSNKIIFNLGRCFSNWCIKTLITDITIKSKIIIGSINNFRYHLDILTGSNQYEFDDMLQILNKQGKVIVCLYSNGDVYWGYDDTNDILKTIVDTQSSFYKINFLDYIAAGFMHGYYDGKLSVEKCVEEGIKWAEEEYSLRGLDNNDSTSCVIS